MHKFLIIRTGGTFETYAEKNKDFEHWTAAGMGLNDDQWDCVAVHKGESLPDPADYAGCAITGSHAMVTDDAQWIRDTKDWIRQAVDAGLPMLGICFGHQLMADALGGKAGYHPDGMEIGTVDIALTDAGTKDILFGSLPQHFKAHAIHSQTALELPPDAVLLAANNHDPHHAFRFGNHAWGVQFHPEFDTDAMRNYVNELRDDLTKKGRDVDAIAASVTDTPESAGLLKRFAEYCLERQ